MAQAYQLNNVISVFHPLNTLCKLRIFKPAGVFLVKAATKINRICLVFSAAITKNYYCRFDNKVLETALALNSCEV